MVLRDYIYNKPVIETGRLILRPLVSSDIAALKEWMPDKSIYTYWGKGEYGTKASVDTGRYQKYRILQDVGKMWIYKRRNDQTGENG